MDAAWVNTLLGFVSGALVAIFAEPIRAWLLGPRVVVEFHNDAAHVARTPEVTPRADGTVHQHTAIYVRVSVTNRRGGLARSCTGYLVKVERKNPQTGRYEEGRFYDPAQLSWASRMDAFDAIDLPRGITQFLDVLSTREVPPNVFNLQTRVKPFREFGLGSTPGTYRCTIMVAGDNFSPSTTELVVEWPGVWDAIAISQSAGATDDLL